MVGRWAASFPPSNGVHRRRQQKVSLMHTNTQILAMVRPLLLVATVLCTVAVHGHAHVVEGGDRKWDCIHDKVQQNTVVHMASQTYAPPATDGRRQAEEWQPIRIAVIPIFDDSLGKK
jgi:hypothetical protein